MDNIKVFLDTQMLYQTKYNKQTEQLQRRTQVYQEPAETLCVDTKGNFEAAPIIGFSHSGTVSCAYNYAKYGDNKVCMLNFANPFTAGGGVVNGANAQEESICRCTNLYASLTTEQALKEYYEYNKRLMDVPEGTNALIYSPDVLIYKDDVHYEPLRAKKCDVITCAAPIGGNSRKLYPVLLKRVEGIVKVAVCNQVNVLILGAWGCGVFGQDPEVIAQVFAEVLIHYANHFKIISFAILDRNRELKTQFWKTFKDRWDKYAG